MGKQQQRIDLILAGFMAVCCLMMLPGCSWLTTVKGYDGDRLSEDQTAIVKTGKDYAVHYVNDQRVFLQYHNWWLPGLTKTKAEVLPGRHEMRVAHAAIGWDTGWCDLAFIAEAGKTYVVEGRRLGDEEAQSIEAFTVKRGPETARVVVWVEEEATKERVSFNETYVDDR